MQPAEHQHAADARHQRVDVVRRAWSLRVPDLLADCRHDDSQQRRDDAPRQQGSSDGCACKGVGDFVELHYYYWIDVDYKLGRATMVGAENATAVPTALVTAPDTYTVAP